MRRVVGVVMLAVIPLAACGEDSSPSGTQQPQPEVAGPAGVIDAVRCAEIASALAAAAVAAPLAATGAAGELGGSVQTLDAFASDAPDEIREDMQIVAEGYAEVSQALQGADFDPASGQPPPPEVIAELDAASQSLSEPAFQEALARINTWFATECGA